MDALALPCLSIFEWDPDNAQNLPAEYHSMTVPPTTIKTLTVRGLHHLPLCIMKQQNVEVIQFVEVLDATELYDALDGIMHMVTLDFQNLFNEEQEALLDFIRLVQRSSLRHCNLVLVDKSCLLRFPNGKPTFVAVDADVDA
jgi:hypothetical protein